MQKKQLTKLNGTKLWILWKWFKLSFVMMERRGWDSNPRSRFWQDTAFRERGHQPLGNLSMTIEPCNTLIPIYFLNRTVNDLLDFAFE